MDIMSEETKPAVTKDEVISVKIKGTDGEVVTFKVKPTTKFKKIMEAYAQRKAISVETMKLIFEGERIQENQTPQDFNMEDGDVSITIVEKFY